MFISTGSQISIGLCHGIDLEKTGTVLWRIPVTIRRILSLLPAAKMTFAVCDAATPA
jgi:hypothetical protein